jgi:hypothetical protein
VRLAVAFFPWHRRALVAQRPKFWHTHGNADELQGKPEGRRRMWDDDRDTLMDQDAFDDLPSSELPTSSLRITARMAATRASRSEEGRSTGSHPSVLPRATDGPRLSAGPRRTLRPDSSSTTARVTAVPPRITAQVPAVTRRQTAPVRRLRPGESELVARTTQVLSIVEAIREQDVVIREQDVVPIQNDDPTTLLPVTILPASKGALMLPPARGPRRPKSRYGIAAAWGFGILLVVAVLASVGPLAGQLSRQGAFTPRAVLLASGDGIPHPSGPWDTSAGALNDLGVGGGAGPGVQAPGSAGLPVSTGSQARPQPAAAPRAPTTASQSAPKPAPTPKPAPAPAVSPAPVHPWPPSNPYMVVPGRPWGYAVAEPSPDYYWWAWGQCTWWAQHMRSDENLKGMGNARYWAAGAAARGYRVGGNPAAGATVVFQPGVQGAGGAGHVAHVVAVYPGGWFLVSEMNFYWNGGGWARVDYRFAHAGPGVSFIY